MPSRRRERCGLCGRAARTFRLIHVGGQWVCRRHFEDWTEFRETIVVNGAMVELGQ